MVERLPQDKNVERLMTLHPDVIIVHGSGLQEMINPEGKNVGKHGWLEEDYEKAMQKLREGEEDLSLYERKTISWLIDHGTGAYYLPKSSWDARMRLTAAGDLWQRYQSQGKEVKVMAVGGDNYPTLAPSIAETMKEDLMRRFHVPEEDIIVVSEGGNTVSDDEQIIKVMQREGFQTAIDISSGYHKVAESLSGKRGARFVSAKDILEGRHNLYSKIISDIYRSRPIRSLIFNQFVGVLILNIPRRGKELYEQRSKNQHLGKGPEGGAVVTVFDPYGLQEMTGKRKRAVVK